MEPLPGAGLCHIPCYLPVNPTVAIFQAILYDQPVQTSQEWSLIVLSEFILPGFSFNRGV